MLLSICTNSGNPKNFSGLNPVDKLLLQKLVSLIFADISRHRSEAVASALQLRKTYVGETPNKASLTPVEESVVAYIAGYVGRKTRDRLQRYHQARSWGISRGVLIHLSDEKRLA